LQDVTVGWRIEQFHYVLARFEDFPLNLDYLMRSDHRLLIPLIRFSERREGDCEEHESEGG
jgi:hypothetical protein